VPNDDEAVLLVVALLRRPEIMAALEAIYASHVAATSTVLSEAAPGTPVRSTDSWLL
jgi:hypothetical protein